MLTLNILINIFPHNYSVFGALVWCGEKLVLRFIFEVISYGGRGGGIEF